MLNQLNKKRQRRHKNKNLFFVLTMIAFIPLFKVTSVFGQSEEVYGKWTIERIIFSASPHDSELNKILKDCLNKKIIITQSKFIFKAKCCSMYRSMTNFKITKRYILTLQAASKDVNYSDKGILYIFNDGKRESIKAYKTNYTYDSSEGDVPELEILLADNDHIIINQDYCIVFLRRDKSRAN